jgi:hypothetical protein
VLLATHGIALYRVDRDWAITHLIPLFNWQRSKNEARGAWEGFLLSPSLYRPFMEAIKPYFLEAARHYQLLGEHQEQYAALLTFAALDPGDTFSLAELAAATAALPVEGLLYTVHSLTRALEGAGDQRSEYWRNRVLPYLRSIWPKSQDLVTPNIAEGFARLCIATKELFSEAVHELQHWLVPHNADLAVHLLQESGLCTRFPEAALTFLDSILGDATQWIPRELGRCLEQIENTNVQLRNDSRFQRLAEYLRRNGVT